MLRNVIVVKRSTVLAEKYRRTACLWLTQDKEKAYQIINAPPEWMSYYRSGQNYLLQTNRAFHHHPSLSLHEEEQ